MTNSIDIAGDAKQLAHDAQRIAEKANALADKTITLQVQAQDIVPNAAAASDPFIFGLTVFMLACFVGYYVVWKVTPALHTPLMSVTNAISGIIVVGAIIAVGADGFGISTWLGFVAVAIASINIFGGFIVTQRMLHMFKKKQ